MDRCGQEVRYVIDFYFHEHAAGTPEVRLHEPLKTALCLAPLQRALHVCEQGQPYVLRL